MKRLYLSLLFTGFTAWGAFAQTPENCNNNFDDDGDGLVDCLDPDCTGTKVCEVCDDGIDNDGDGFIDCFDKECSKSKSCEDSYVGNDNLCSNKPSTFPKFSIRLDYETAPRTATHLARVVVGDIDRDGIPEIVSADKVDNSINITTKLGGVVTTRKGYTNIGGKYGNFSPGYEDIAIANLDNDNCAEIFVVSGDAKSIYAYDCNFNQIWAAPISLPFHLGTMGFADFNGDGKVELYVRNRIYNASTGTLIAQGPETFNKDVNGGPVAVDINGDSRLELICGLKIYDVDIGAGTITPNAGLSSSRYFTRTAENTTSVADYDQDGFLDVLTVGSLDAAGANTTVFFWNLHKSHTATIDPELKTFQDFQPPGTASGKDPWKYATGWVNATGRINIADIDGNGKLNASFVSGRFLYALNEDLTLRWRSDVFEETSGFTGCTMFDFNGDGSSEIVYRDENNIYIIRDDAGVPVKSPPVPCLSRTNQDYPVVADVDGDNQTEICVTCRVSNIDKNGNGNGANTDIEDPSHVRVYESGDPVNSPWVPARRVWNQHGYFNVNVNNDLTIPKMQQKHHLVFSLGGNCTIGKNRPLNSFLNQSPYLDSQGCPKYTAPDLVFSDEKLIVTPPTCPDKTFKIAFGIKNIGEATINGEIPVTFYKGNPLKTSTAQKLNTVKLQVNNFGQNDSLSVKPDVIGTGESFWLYIVLNDAGTSNAPIKLPNTGLLECDYDNMDSVLVRPLSVPVTAEKKDFFKCIDPLNPTAGVNTGVVNAYVMINGVKNTTDFNFYWTKGGTQATVKPIPADYTGSTINGLAEDDYWVYAIHKTASCNSDTAVTKPLAINQTVTVAINLQNEVTNCLNPNGKLDAVVNNDPTLAAQYDFAWYEASQYLTGAIVSTTHSASGLKATSYRVLVTNKTSGCTGDALGIVPQNTPKPPIVATIDDLSCSATGTPAKATATINGQTTGYTFSWYNGSFTKPGTPDNSNSVYPNLPVGAPNTFTVFAVHTASQCSSDTITVTLKTSNPPVVDATKTQDQISCDPSNVLGAAKVDITGYDPAKFSIQWYKGPNTVTAIAGATGLTITNKAVGTYTVKVTDLVTTCSATDQVQIDLNTPMPVVAALNIVANSACIPSNGGFEASVTPGPVTDYTFFLNDGTSTVSQASNIFTGLEPKDYSLHAVNNITKCITDDVPVSIIDNRPTISLDSVTFTVPTDCTSPNGSMTVQASSTAATTGFVFRWYRGGTPAGTPLKTETLTAGPYLSTLSNIQSGAYTAEVEDLSTGCKHSKEFFLGFANSHFLKYKSDTPITNCVPGEGGSVTVNLIATTTLPGYSQDSYDLYVYEGANDPHAGSTDPSIDAAYLESMITHPGSPLSTANYTTTYPSLKANTTYTFVAVSKFGPTEGCRVSVSRKMRVQTTNPAVTADPMAVMANKNCNLTTTSGSGSIHVTMNNPATQYAFAWTDITAGTVVATAGVNGEDAVNLKPGSYKVRATYTTALNQGCFVEKTYNVVNNEQQIMVAAGGLTLSDLVNCDPLTGNTPLNEGGAEFTQLSVDGAPVSAPFAGYAFNWFNANATPATGTIAPPYKIIQLTSGEYYVTAVNATTTCDVTQSFTINDATINTVFVELVDFKRELRCVRPDVGFLQVEAHGTSATNNYSFQWFNGPTVSSPVRPEVGTTITGLEARQFFTVRVTNNDNGCRAVETYDLDQQVNPIQMQAFASPLTECVNATLGTGNDSQLSSLVTNDAAGNQVNYRFDWFVDVGNDNNPANDVAIGTTRIINNVGIEGNQLIVAASSYPNQQIYVIAVDLVDVKLNHETLCRSELFKVNIEDFRMPPPVVVAEVMPMTNCVATDELANGIASANVNGDITNYTFDWFKGTPVPPVTPPGFYNGVEASGLQPYEHPSRPGVFVEYTVLATNITSGCSNTAPLRIDNKPVAGPDVQVIVTSLNVRCDAVNTGELQANVGGVTANYIFDWYDGDFHDEVNAPRPTPDNVGEFYSELANGFYSVMATSVLTGCRSRLKAEEITPKTVIPDFNFEIVPALCEDSTGRASISLTVPDAEVETIVWTDLNGNVVSTGPILGGAMTGDYIVTVTTLEACSATKPVHIPSEIKPFNGISRNGDNKNSYFHINCIEEFESNIVKVFNRAGTLVYQAEGYDNNNILFDGISNKGISPMGTNLPDGTYFFIIDKRNGSKPVAGYLEIVN